MHGVAATQCLLATSSQRYDEGGWPPLMDTSRRSGGTASVASVAVRHRRLGVRGLVVRGNLRRRGVPCRLPDGTYAAATVNG